MTDHPPAADADAPRPAGAPAEPPALPPEPPALPPELLDPRPVVAAGFAAWAVATIVVLAVGGTSAAALPVCYAGLVIGALGTAIFLLQRRGARAGRKGAQKGLS